MRMLLSKRMRRQADECQMSVDPGATFESADEAHLRSGGASPASLL
jgi:hypothetical protein